MSARRHRGEGIGGGPVPGKRKAPLCQRGLQRMGWSVSVLDNGDAFLPPWLVKAINECSRKMIIIGAAPCQIQPWPVVQCQRLHAFRMFGDRSLTGMAKLGFFDDFRAQLLPTVCWNTRALPSGHPWGIRRWQSRQAAYGTVPTFGSKEWSPGSNGWKHAIGGYCLVAPGHPDGTVL